MRLQDSHNSPEYVYKIAKTHRPELQNSNTVIKPTQAKDTPKERTGSHPAFYAPYLAKNAKLHTESRRNNSEKPYTAGYSDFDQKDKKTRQKGATKKQKLGRSLDIYTQIKKHCLLQPDHTKVQQCSSFIICRRELHIHLLDKLSSQVFNFRLHLLDLVQVFLALSFFNKLFERSRWSKNPDMRKNVFLTQAWAASLRKSWRRTGINEANRPHDFPSSSGIRRRLAIHWEDRHKFFQFSSATDNLAVRSCTDFKAYKICYSFQPRKPTYPWLGNSSSTLQLHWIANMIARRVFISQGAVYMDQVHKLNNLAAPKKEDTDKT